jgi:hypothetical protein
MGREVREELDLEALGQGPSSVTWWRREEQRLTLDTITAYEGQDETGSGEEGVEVKEVNRNRHPCDDIWEEDAGHAGHFKSHSSAAESEDNVVWGTRALEGNAANKPEAAQQGFERQHLCEDPWLQDVKHLERCNTAAGGAQSGPIGAAMHEGGADKKGSKR